MNGTHSLLYFAAAPFRSDFTVIVCVGAGTVTGALIKQKSSIVCPLSDFLRPWTCAEAASSHVYLMLTGTVTLTITEECAQAHPQSQNFAQLYIIFSIQFQIEIGKQFSEKRHKHQKQWESRVMGCKESKIAPPADLGMGMKMQNQNPLGVDSEDSLSLKYYKIR